MSGLVSTLGSESLARFCTSRYSASAAMRVASASVTRRPRSRQPLDDRVVVIVERDDGVLAAERAERALRLRQLSFDAVDLVLEEVPRLPGELELRLQALEDEAARVRVGDALREPGVRAGEADLDEARVGDGFHIEPLAVAPDQAGRNAVESGL